MRLRPVPEPDRSSLKTMTHTRPGRPRDEKVDRAILASARDLIREGGYEALTIVGVADRAGVGKQSITRRWSTKAELVAQCVIEGIVPLDTILAQSTGDVAADLEGWIEQSSQKLSDPGARQLFRALAAASASDHGAAGRLDELFGSAVRESLIVSFRAGPPGLPAGSDRALESLADALIGMMLYAILVGQPVDRQAMTALARATLAGLGALPQPSDDDVR